MCIRCMTGFNLGNRMYGWDVCVVGVWQALIVYTGSRDFVYFTAGTKF